MKDLNNKFKVIWYAECRIKGYVTGIDGIGIPNIGVELWTSDNKGKPQFGTKPILRTTTLIGGQFNLSIRKIGPDIKLPKNMCILFLDRKGNEIGVITISPEIKEGQVLHLKTDIKTPSRIDIWTQPYTAPKLINENIKNNLSSDPSNGLSQQSVPLISQFAKYVYIDPRPAYQTDEEGNPILISAWPWNVTEDELSYAPPLQQNYLLGVEVNYQQKWNFLGYARGELIHSLPIAPGEETTLEVYSWDRNIYKREEEITNDMERELEQNQQLKENREVFREMKKNNKWYVDAEVSAKASWGFSSVSAKVSGGYSSEANSDNKDTLYTLADTTSSSVNKVREQRKTLITSTREFGREDRVTRKIANTNRCHTVNYHFYEVLQNFEIENYLIKPVRPCFYLKRQMKIFGSDITGDELKNMDENQGQKFIEALRWIHRNNHLIAQSLLSRSLYQGLELVPKILATMMLKPVIQIPDINIDPYIRSYARAIVDATQKIQDAFYMPLEHSWLDPDNYSRFLLKGNIYIYSPWIYELILGESQEGSLEYALATETAEHNDLVRAVEKFFEEWDVAYGNLNTDIPHTILL